MPYLFLCVLFVLTGCAAELSQSASGSLSTQSSVSYESSQSCKGCHSDIYLQYEDSEHSKAFVNPVFKAQYFKDIVPRAERDPAFVAEARKCIYCHAPVVYMNITGLIRTEQQVAHLETGVTCDFCHTLSGYAPNGDYQQNPSRKKLGPFEKESWHSEYSGFISMSEFCGPCHNSTNHAGVDVKATFDEWQASAFKEKRITCQDCHMNRNGYLKDGVAEFDSGAVAHLRLGWRDLEVGKREKLYTHTFPGAHSNSQLTDTMRVEFKRGDLTPGGDGKLHFGILVDNSHSGHSMPTGSSDLRLLWLEVTAATPEGKPVPVKLTQTPKRGFERYAITGGTPADARVLGAQIRSGSRVYRALYLDGSGRPSLLSSEAVKKVFDNRLKAGEVRREEYLLQLPDQYVGTVDVTATLYYQGAPASFTGRLGVPDFKPVVVTTTTKRMTILSSKSGGTQ